ncbi:MAG: DedA family protein [Candidatus Saccharibacteria bacterium]
MNYFLHSALSLIADYRYLGLFGVTFLCAFVLPFPSATALMTVAALAGARDYNIWLVMLTALAGNVAGDSAGYWTGRSYGERLLTMAGFGRILASERTAKLKDRFSRFESWVILLSRFNDLSTITVNLVAGMNRTVYRKYLAYEIIGEAVQVAFFAGIGFYFGSNWQAIYAYLGTRALAFLAAGLVIAYLLARIVQSGLSGRFGHR